MQNSHLIQCAKVQVNMLCAERFFKKLLLSHPAFFYYVVLCPGFSLGNFQGVIPWYSQRHCHG